MADRQGLETGDLTVRYGGVVAVDRISLSVARGEVVGLIGPNGAGKTSFVDAVTGFAPSTGRIAVDGVDIAGMRPHSRVRAGLSRTWQQGELFDDLTVEQNLLVAAQGLSTMTVFSDLFGRRADSMPAVDTTLDRLGLRELADCKPAEISLGHQKLVGVGRALITDPAVVLLDEPAAGLDTDESEDFGSVVRNLAAHGHAVLLIEHDMAIVRQVCSRLYVMDYGRLLTHGPTADVIKDPAVVAAYLGSSAPSPTGEQL